MKSIATAIVIVTGMVMARPAAAVPCDADINGDGTVNTLDLGILLASWTLPPARACAGSACASDLNGDDVVNTLDLGFLLSAWDAICNQPTETELAGNSLAQYPYFEYVMAFNQGAPIQVAIDPTRFPSIAGDTADIYVVADKSTAQWTSDPSLVDLTPGGAMTVTFSAGMIQANTFTVDSGTLSAAAGIDIGVPYDVVVDMNLNGVLDGGDFIDGLSSAGGAGGLYVVHDVTLPGPLAVTSMIYAVTGITSGLSQEQTFYPTGIASMGQLPLVVASHATGDSYTMFGHVGMHLASYGFIVMSNQSDSVPGPFSASTTTLEHTNAIIGQQDMIGGGVLNGHIDASRIVWIGHSRAGEGVAIAYDRVFDGTFTPVGWNLDSIKLVSSMAPTDFNGTAVANPHHANFHLWVVAADANVNGCASSDIAQPYHVLERAGGFRQSICIFGAGHEDLMGSIGSSVASGPCLIGRPNTHAIMRGYLLPLVKHYVDGNFPAKDFLTRQWESFRPIGAPSLICPATGQQSIVVNLTYRDGPVAGNFNIDDYQSGPSPADSSSGGAVTTLNVRNLVEGRLDDSNSDFNWTAADPMNGMTYGGASDDTRGVVFDWIAPSYYEESIVPAARDFTARTFLSFRACQGTRHPNTILELGDLSFNVTLRDGAGVTSSINIITYGGGIEEPYQRTGCGAGPGWNNEFETIRIRLSDFLNNGSGLDLTSIVAVRFEFGGPGTSAVGRLGLDEIQLTVD